MDESNAHDQQSENVRRVLMNAMQDIQRHAKGILKAAERAATTLKDTGSTNRTARPRQQ